MRSFPPLHPLALVLAMAIGVAGVTPAIAVGAVERPSGPKTQAMAVSGSLKQNPVTVVRGNTAEITFEHSGPATLYVGGEDVGYKLEVQVSGSGTSTVSINTYASTAANPDSYVSGGDATLLYPEGGLDEALAPGRYLLNVTVNGTPVALGSLVIEERPSTTVSAYVAPGSISPEDISQSELVSKATKRTSVARGDLALLVFDTTGLREAVNPESLDGSKAANGIDVHFEDVNPPPNAGEHSFDATESSAVTVLWDEKKGQLVLAWDTSNVALPTGRRTYNVTFRIESDHNTLVTADVLEANTTIRIQRPFLRLTTEEQLTIDPWESGTIQLRGETNLAPGTTLQFRASDTEPRPFLREATATVKSAGTFATEIDLGGVPNGIEFPLSILGRPGFGAWRVTTRATEASLSLANQTASDGRQIVVRNVTLSVGGFVVVTQPDGTVLGISGPFNESSIVALTIQLRPPLEQTRTLRATAYVDWNQDRRFDEADDRPYREDGSIVSDSAVIGVPRPVRTPTSTPTPTPTATSRMSVTTTSVTPTLTSAHSPATGTPTAPPSHTSTRVTTLSVREQPPLTAPSTPTRTPLSPGLVLIGLLAAGLLGGRRRAG